MKPRLLCRLGLHRYVEWSCGRGGNRITWMGCYRTYCHAIVATGDPK